jgi:molybdopterin molybdotransferase
VLAADQRSCLDLPPFDKAAMDGYAVLGGDHRASYRVLETVAAGTVPAQKLEPGAAVKVMTGAPVPAGAGEVIPVEHVRLRGDAIEVLQRGRDPNICPQGEDVRRGDVVLRAGTRVGPLDVANLIGCGMTQVEVFRAPRLAIISTGDEITDDPARLGPGKIMNTNGPMLAGLARQFRLEVVGEHALSDDRAAIAAGLRAALDQAQIVVLSGGVSVGDFDFVTAALSDAELRVHFTAVAVKPGRPTTYASAPGKAVFGLPGNPVSVFLMFHLFVLQAVAQLTRAPVPMRQFPMPLGSAFARRRAERLEYVPCRIDQRGTLQPVEFHGSAHLTGLTAADGFFLVPIGVQSAPAGQPVEFMPVKGWP